MAWYDYFTAPARAGSSWLGGAGGYNTAARGAQDVSQQSREFSDEQWRRQMEGLDKAQAAYGPSQQYWNSTYGSQGPGAMETWWNQNQSAFNRQPLQQQAYNGYTDWMNNGVNATQQGANAANQYLGGPTASSQAWGSMGQGLQSYSGPQSGQEAYRYNQPSYQQSGAGESFYDQNKARYNQETNSQAAYEHLNRQLETQTAVDSFYENNKKRMSDQEMRDKMNLLRHQAYAEGPTALQLNEGENKGYIRGANQLADYYGSQQGALQGPGAYEQFVTADIMGRNPAMERQRSEGIARINQEMARRGGFKSGAAMTAIGNYTGALDAADYENRARRAQSAQQMELSRIGQGTQSAQAAAGMDVQRGGALGQLDTASEQAQAGRQQIGIQAEQNMLQAEANRNRLEFDASKASSDSALARLMAQGELAGQADSQNLGLLNSGQNAAADAQRLMLERLMGYQNSANSVDQTRLASDQQALARMMASFNMAQGSDASGLARAQQLFNQGQGLDQNMMARFGQQAQMGQGIDQATLAQLLGGGQMAGQAQNAQQQRMMQAFSSLFGLNNAQAGQVGQFYGQGGQLSGQAFQDAMNALMAMYGYKAEAQNAGPNALKELGGYAAGRA